MSNLLDGRRLLVTGASSGIGEAIARACVDAGAEVACLARSADRLAKLADEIGIVDVTADVGDVDAVKEAVDTASHRLGGLDGVVNNAGLMIHGRLSLGLTDDWRRMVDVNLLGPMHVTSAALRHLRQAGASDVIMVTSTSARRVSQADYALYSATKSAVNMLAKGWRQEFVDDGIRVSTVAPGLVRDTGFGPGIRDDQLREQVLSTKQDLGMPPSLVAAQVVHVLTMPAGARIDDLVLVPTWQVS